MVKTTLLEHFVGRATRLGDAGHVHGLDGKCVTALDARLGHRREQSAAVVVLDHQHHSAIFIGEIEELLFTHPKISVVACVAMPDPVLSERVCAYVVCEPEQVLGFDEMVAFLRKKKVSNWKLPERLELRDEFPMTPSGKIQKFMLREEIAALLRSEQSSG